MEDCDVEDDMVNYKSDKREDCDVEDGLVHYKSDNMEGKIVTKKNIW